MAQLTRQSIPETGLTPVMASASSGGDTFPNSGKEMLLIVNGSGSEVTVTVVAQKTEVHTDQYGKLDKANASVTIDAGEIGLLPPLAPSVFNSNGQALINYSSAADVEVAVLQI